MLAWILLTYLILTIRLRVAETLFGRKSWKSKLTLLSIGSGIAVFLFFLPRLLERVWISISWFEFHPSLLRWTILWYTILACYEEISKLLWAGVSYLTEHLTRNDLILYSIVIALWFAFGESVIYIITKAQWISESTTLAVSRWLTWFLGHAMFSGTIAYIWSKRVGGNILWSLLIWIIALSVGISLHVWYNLLLHYWFVLWYMLYIVWGYLLLSYLFYSSDRVYLD